jgi:mRNA interferase RelE/StbE
MYAIEFLPSAKKELSELDRVIQKQLKEKIILLASNPAALKNNIKSLKGEYSGKFRLRVRDYRVIFQIVDEKVLILIVRIGHRKEVY